MKKVKAPNTTLLDRFCLNSCMSISKPAKNMMYCKPTVPNKMILISRAIKFKPFGPIIAPAIIKPIRCGIRNLFKTIGANKMMNSIKENNNTGFLSGKVKSIPTKKSIVPNLKIKNNIITLPKIIYKMSSILKIQSRNNLLNILFFSFGIN